MILRPGQRQNLSCIARPLVAETNKYLVQHKETVALLDEGLHAIRTLPAEEKHAVLVRPHFKLLDDDG